MVFPYYIIYDIANFNAIFIIANPDKEHEFEIHSPYTVNIIIRYWEIFKNSMNLRYDSVEPKFITLIKQSVLTLKEQENLGKC